MGLDDITKMLTKVSEQQRALTKLGPFADIASKSIASQQLLSKPMLSNWFIRNEGLFGYLDDYNKIGGILSKNASQLYIHPKVYRPVMEELNNSFFVKNSIISNNIASIVSQGAFMSKIENFSLLGSGYPNGKQYQGLINSMQILTAKVAVMGLSKSISEFYYEDAETVTSEVAEIVNSVKDQTLNPNDFADKLLRLLQSIQGLLTKGDPQALFSIWLGIVGILLTTYTYIHPKNTQISEDGLHVNESRYKKISHDLQNTVSESFNIFSVKRIINHPCKLYSNSKFRSNITGLMARGDSIVVINTHGKWASIMFMGKDSLPICGWVLKKYLAKPHK